MKLDKKYLTIAILNITITVIISLIVKAMLLKLVFSGFTIGILNATLLYYITYINEKKQLKIYDWLATIFIITAVIGLSIGFVSLLIYIITLI